MQFLYTKYSPTVSCKFVHALACWLQLASLTTSDSCSLEGTCSYAYTNKSGPYQYKSYQLKATFYKTCFGSGLFD